MIIHRPFTATPATRTADGRLLPQHPPSRSGRCGSSGGERADPTVWPLRLARYAASPPHERRVPGPTTDPDTSTRAHRAGASR